MVLSKTIGLKIQEARKSKNLSQLQLSQQLFISPQAVGKWERGESLPDISMLHKLAGIFGTDLNYFADNEEISTGSFMDGELVAPRPDDAALSDLSKKITRDMSGWNWRDADFAGTELLGVNFKASDMENACFDDSVIADCILTSLNLANASFRHARIDRTDFSASNLAKVKFIAVKFNRVDLRLMELSQTIFEECEFRDVDFSRSDLSGLNFDGMRFTNVSFNNAALKNVSFRNSVLDNVSFHAPYAITNRYYRVLKTINFEGSKIDKLSYAKLKSLGAELAGTEMF